MVERKAKAIVIACNTATGTAIAGLQSRFPLPAIGIAAAVKPAVGKTARDLRHRPELLPPDPGHGTERFWIGGDPAEAKPAISQLWKADVEMQRLPGHYRRTHGTSMAADAGRNSECISRFSTTGKEDRPDSASCLL